MFIQLPLPFPASEYLVEKNLDSIWSESSEPKVLLVDLDNVHSKPKRNKLRLEALLTIARQADFVAFAGSADLVSKAAPHLAEYNNKPSIFIVPNPKNNSTDTVLLEKAETFLQGRTAQFAVASNGKSFALLSQQGSLTILTPDLEAMSPVTIAVANSYFDLRSVEGEYNRAKVQEQNREKDAADLIIFRKKMAEIYGVHSSRANPKRKICREASKVKRLPKDHYTKMLSNKVLPAKDINNMWIENGGQRILLVDLDNNLPDKFAIKYYMQALLRVAKQADQVLFAGLADNIERSRAYLGEFDSPEHLAIVPPGKDSADNYLISKALGLAKNTKTQFAVVSHDHAFSCLAEYGHLFIITPVGRSISSDLIAVSSGVLDLKSYKVNPHKRTFLRTKESSLL
jgi:hypothetical protein